LREQAAEWREANSNGGAEAFPALAASDVNAAETNAPLRVGWASGTTLKRLGRSAEVGAVTEEAFPALGPSSRKDQASSASSTATAKLKANNRHSTIARQSASATSSWGVNRVAPVQQSTTSSFVTPSTGSAVTRNQQRNLTADNFPSLVGGPSSDSRPIPYAAATSLSREQQTQQQLTKKKSPSLNSLSDFPPPPSSQETATVEDMKATLGPKYKELKRLTKEFAIGGLGSQAYVDMAASLFDRGYADPHFWTFLPALLAGCPNQDKSRSALTYMENLKQTKNKSSLNRDQIDGKKTAWGSGGPAQRVKNNSMLPALSVAQAAAASSTAAINGSTSNKNGKKKKGKQKNELRDLAFGK
jgi:hypothetical protein